ncbi:MAG TPA: hypothetical protein VKV02_03325 [Acidobacteriaceae bacterium]|nr:hypothetical protein [Acidobacteriaceae bacterium]
MYRRLLQLVLVAAAILCVMALFVPWTRLFFMTNEQATRFLFVKMLALPVFALCVLGAVWASQKPRTRAR